MTASAIVHVGVGAFHRAHQAPLYDLLLQDDPDSPWSVCGVGVLPGDATVRDGLRDQGFAYTLLLKHPDGSVERSVVRSVRDMLLVPDDPEAVVARLADPATRLVTLTVTEGGYALDTAAVRADLVPGALPRTVFGVVVEALRRRWAAGVPPFTVLSCDNLEGNGHVARAAFAGFARLRDACLGARVEREVAFPSSMVDRIAPVVTDADRALAGEAVPVVAEPWHQWVLEDDFPLGRPALERVGVQLVPDVRPYELMKLRLLNGGHQAVAYAGLLLGHELVHDAVADPDVQRLLRRYLEDDATPSLAPVPGVDLADYREQLVVRFGNAAVRDTLARLAACSTDRLPGFVVPVVAEGLAAGRPVAAATAVLGCWLRWTETHPDDVADPGWCGRTPEQLLADPALFADALRGPVAHALGVLRALPPREALRALV